MARLAGSASDGVGAEGARRGDRRAGAAREREQVGVRLPARPRAGRGAGASRFQPAAARPDAAHEGAPRRSGPRAHGAGARAVRARGRGGRGHRPRCCGGARPGGRAARRSSPASPLIRIGTRGSALALAQARWVADRIEDEYELVTITTAGDRGEQASDKSRWVSALEQALLEERIDLAVHSAKDVPAELAEGLELVAIPARADARDAICGAASLAVL